MTNGCFPNSPSPVFVDLKMEAELGENRSDAPSKERKGAEQTGSSTFSHPRRIVET